MRKTKKIITLIAALTLLGGVSAQPTSAAIDQGSGIVSPNYIAMERAIVSLIRDTDKSVICKGATYVSNDYIAGISVELQMSKDGENWTYVKKWTKKGGTKSVIDEPYSVSSGYYYRLKSIHSSYDKNGNLLDSQTKYSNIVK